MSKEASAPRRSWRSDEPVIGRSLLLASLGGLVGAMIAGVALVAMRGVGMGLPPEDVAIVNGVPVLRVDYAQQLHALYGDAPRTPTSAERRRVLEDMIQEELRIQRGLELGLATDDIDVRAALVRGTEAQTATDATTTRPTEAELHAWYDRHRARYASEGTLDIVDYRLTPGQAPRAAALAAALRSGRSAASLGLNSAGTFDDGPQFDFIARLRLGDSLYARARALPDGGVTDPVMRPDGLHIARLIHQEKPLPSTFEASRAKVAEDWTADKVQRLTSANDRFLRGRADIRIARDLR